MLKKYKCSRCETIGEAVSEMRFTCPVCGAKMLQLEKEQEVKLGQEKINCLPEAKVVSLGFYDLLPIPAGSKLDTFKQKLQITKITDTIQVRDSSTAFKGLSEIIYNPINDDIPGNFKKQRRRQIRFYFFLGIISSVLFLTLFLCLV